MPARSTLRIARLVITLIIAVCFYLYFSKAHGGSTNTIEYHGQTFKLSKSYWSYESYKDDPDNLPASELPAIEKAILDVKLPTTLHDRDSLFHEVFGLTFPGYGSSSPCESPQPDGSSLLGFSTEIPQRDKDRFVLYHKVGNTYTLIDDFPVSTASPPGIHATKIDGSSILYLDRTGRTILKHPLPSSTTKPGTTG